MFTLVKAHRTYSTASARLKIDFFATKGYQLVGSLPADLSFWPSMRLCSFLFKKEERYYQCRWGFLFWDTPIEQIELSFNEQKQRTLPPQPLSPINTSSFIFVALMCPQNQGIFLIREDADVTGHHFLAGAWSKEESIGGELYFEKSNLLLINPKSGYFHTPTDKALAALNLLGDHFLVQKFHPAVETEEVKLELTRRKAIENQEGSKEESLPLPSPAFFGEPISRKQLSGQIKESMHKESSCISCSLM